MVLVTLSPSGTISAQRKSSFIAAVIPVLAVGVRTFLKLSPPPLKLSCERSNLQTGKNLNTFPMFLFGCWIFPLLLRAVAILIMSSFYRPVGFDLLTATKQDILF